MATYRCAKELFGKTLKWNDTVYFGDIKYKVANDYLSNEEGSNSAVWQAAGMGRNEYVLLACIAYQEDIGEKSWGWLHEHEGDWPSTPHANIPLGYIDLTRLVLLTYVTLGIIDPPAEEV